MELIQKQPAKRTDLSRITDAALLKIGERAMQRYLEGVTGKVAKRTRRGSDGETKLRAYDVETAPGAVTGIVTLTRGLALQELGGVIQARNVTYMTIPLKAALKPDGTPKRLRARDWQQTRVITSKRGTLLIVQRRGPKDVPLYALKKTVRIRARLGLRKEMHKQYGGFLKDVQRGVRRLLDT